MTHSFKVGSHREDESQRKTMEDYLRNLDDITKEYFDHEERSKNNGTEQDDQTLENITIRLRELVLTASTTLSNKEFAEFIAVVELRKKTLLRIGEIDFQSGKTRRRIEKTVGGVIGTAGNVIAEASEQLASPAQRLAAAIGIAIGTTVGGLTIGTFRGLYEGGKKAWNIGGNLASAS